MSLWGGRFAGKTDPLFKRFNDSLRFDWRLVAADVQGSKAWATAIHRAGVLTAEELTALHAALDAVAAQAAALGPALAEAGDEDVHSWVESRLIEAVGPLGKKLHTGRSRNDQVATDLRLWTVERLGVLSTAVREVQRALVAFADRSRAVVVPGYTHMQRGQPVLLAHWALAYVEMLGRDQERMADCARRAAVSPLGSGALAGTAYAIDREALAAELGLAGASRNSLDAVADRDFVFEALSACSLCALHLSRWAEDLILYCSSEFAFVQLDDSVSSGSSLMPQKKNPDSLELTRAKAGRVLGALVTLAVVLKGTPLAYNKDLQEDKEPLFDACESLLMVLRMAVPLLETLRVDVAKCRNAALGDGTILATELADYLVGKGVPFRDAHDTAGKAVRLTLSTGTPLHKLALAQLRTLDERIGADVSAALSLEASLARRDVLGGTAPGQVARQIEEARRRLEG